MLHKRLEEINKVWFFHPPCGICSSFAEGQPIVVEVIMKVHPREYEVCVCVSPHARGRVGGGGFDPKRVIPPA